MGFWSKLCNRCEHPALCREACDEDGTNTWMSQVVVINPDGSFHGGEYDGYGRVGDAEDVLADDVTIWHRACWELSGRPLDFDGAADWADDQGWFFEDGAHSIPDPRGELGNDDVW